MAVIQSKLNEIRYMKRDNLKQEAAMVQNMYRDLIRSYGIDCTYYKLNTEKYSEFKNIIDENAILFSAYGYDHDPDYKIQSNMTTFMEVENDIFQLNKFGLNPNMDVNFYFDSTDFACSLATKLGQYKEYKIDEREFTFEIPEFNKQTSADVFPYHLGVGYNEIVTCDLLSGKVDALIEGYEVGKEQTIQCRFSEHTDFEIKFPVNKFIHKSFNYRINSDDYIDQALFFTFKVTKTLVNKNEYKFILNGKIHGAILFYDLSKIGKYQTMIHPDVGDLITIDFPDASSREQYEITEATDKQLTQDGLNPLLHKYIWKCKARRYVNSYEDMEQNEANDIMDETIKERNVIDSTIADKISLYPDNEDAAYGGYDMQDRRYDKNEIGSKTDKKEHQLEYLDPMTAIDILHFECGSKLCTDGYNLIFVNKNDEATRIAAQDLKKYDHLPRLFEQDLEHIKACDEMVVYMDISGNSHIIAWGLSDKDMTNYDIRYDMANEREINICMNSLLDKTYQDHNINNDLDNFYKFSNTRTFLFATENSLFCKLASNGKMYKLA